MKDLNTKNRKEMLKNISAKFPISFTLNEEGDGYHAKAGGIQKFFDSEYIARLLRKSAGVKSSSTCRFIWHISKDVPDSNAIEMVEVVRKGEAQKPKREWNFFEAFLAFLLTVIVGVAIMDVIVTKQKVEVEKLMTCELRGDCVELIKEANK